MLGAALSGISCAGPPPEHLGAAVDRLVPCPGTPNCVSSQEQRERFQVAPLRFTDAPEVAWARLEAVVRSMKRTRVVTSTPTYLHAEFRIAVFGFIDDVECTLDAASKRIDIRSASRLGRSDLGVNRRRVEKIRSAFESARSEEAPRPDGPGG